MRVAARTLGRAAMFAVALSPVMLAARSLAADDTAAHAIAEKFSRAEEAERAAAQKKADAKKKAEAEKARAEAQRQAQRRKAAEEQRAKDEAEMLDRARAEAEARRLEQQHAADEKARLEAEQQAARAEAARLAQEAEQRRIEDDRRAEEARAAEAARLAREVEEKRLADEKAIEEARQAEAARLAAEAEQKRLAEERKAAEDARIAKEAEEKRQAEEHRAARIAKEIKEAEEKRRAEAARKAEEKRQAEAAREALEQRRADEAQRVLEKFRLAHQAHDAKLARERAEQAARDQAEAARDKESEIRNGLGGPTTETRAPTEPWDPSNTGPARFLPTRVTVLLVMDPRHRIFPAYPPKANPVLCIGQGCYISGGDNSPAEYMPRWSALGPANSIGRRAGPCRNQLTCVFRDVELGGGYGQIQPVDMGLLHHDRREIRGVRPDPTCDFVSGRLYCAEPIVARGYRAWVVPEVIAAKAGEAALRGALTLGLPQARSATLTPGLDPWRARIQLDNSR